MPSTPSMAPDPLHNASNSYYMLLRELFFRLVFGLQVESSLSMEIIAFWLWLQQGNGQVGYLQRIYSFDDNHFRAIVSSATRFLELLHFGFDGPETRSVPRSAFQREAIQGISLYLNSICYEALEDLRDRIEMNFVHKQMTYLRQEQSMIDRVPEASSIKDLYEHRYGDSSNEQIPKSSKHVLTKIKALYANTPKHHGEGTRSRNIHVQTSQIYHGEGSSSRNILAQTNHMLRHDTKDEVYDYQSTSHLVTLLDKLSLRENRNDAIDITQHLSDVPPDERTLFVTFSNGYPLTKDELHEFFMRHYGDIEEISVEEPIESRPPLYAHIIFYSQMTLFRVLDGNRRVKFMTRGKHLWARQFVPKKKKKTDV